MQGASLAVSQLGALVLSCTDGASLADALQAGSRPPQVDHPIISFALAQREELAEWLAQVAASPVGLLSWETSPAAFLHARFARWLYQKNQFAAPSPHDWSRLEQSLQRAFTNARGLLQSETSSLDLAEGLRFVLFEVLRARAALLQSAGPGGAALREVVCAEYRPELQLQLLKLAVSSLAAPVLDIGCGESAALVRFLRAQGVPAWGLDRSFEEEEPPSQPGPALRLVSAHDAPKDQPREDRAPHHPQDPHEGEAARNMGLSNEESERDAGNRALVSRPNTRNRTGTNESNSSLHEENAAPQKSSVHQKEKGAKTRSIPFEESAALREFSPRSEQVAARGDWLRADFGVRRWGTMISHQGFSLHFWHQHLAQRPAAEEYARAFMRILGALRAGGTFAYAPGLPFIEAHLPQTQYQIRTHALPEEITAALPSNVRTLPLVGATHITKLR